MKQQKSTMAFKPGQSGNLKGRPKGSKNKLTEAFWKDFADAWEFGGRAAIDTVRSEDPSTFLRVAASLMPKESEVTLRNVIAKDLQDDELADIALGGGEGAIEPALDPSQLN